MLAAIIKWTKKHKSWIFALSVMVVFCTAYVLIMPAQTLEQEEAEQQGGIDLPTAEQSVDTPDESVSEEPQDEGKETDAGQKTDAPEENVDSAKAGLAFEGDGFSITAKAESNAKLPEDTTLTAAEVTPDAKDYEAWYEKAEQALKDSPLVKDGATLKSAKFYDITLQADGREVEPAADVNVKISYDESLKMSRSGDVYVVHFGAAANGEVEAEVLKDSAVDVNSQDSAKAGTVEVSDISFDAPGFSMYGVLETTTLEENVVTADGKDYKVSVTYDADAKVPEGAKLAVSEIETDSDAYKDYVSKSEEALGMDEGTAGYVRLFDIKIVDADGEKVEIAAPVDVKIELADKEKTEKTQVVHFADDSAKGDVVAGAKLDGRDISFKADGFSVYAVVDEGDTTAYARMTVNFYGKDQSSPLATVIVKNSDTPDELQTIIFDPGAGVLDTDDLFMGWTFNKDYTADIVNTPYDSSSAPDGLMTIEDIRGWANDKEIHEGDTADLYAVILRHHTVTYIDDKGVSLGSEPAYYRDGDESALLSINKTYAPQDDTHSFEGWNVAEGEGNIEAATYQGESVETPYKTDTIISINGDVTLKVFLEEGHWLVFDENGKGGTYNAPQFVKTEEVTRKPVDDVEMTRYGYSFTGWYEDPEGNQPFIFGRVLTQKKTIYAKWTPNTTAPYTVVCWTQNLDRTAYDVAGTYAGTGTVGQPIPYTFVNNGDEDYVTGVGDENGHYTGFSLNQSKTSNMTITPEGDAVLNLYFDRITYNLKIYLYRKGTGNNSYQYAENSNAGKNVWGIATWYRATSENNMPTTTYGTIHREQNVDGYDGYYILLSAYYGEDISSKWPKYNQIIGPENNRNPVSFIMMNGTGLKGNGLNDNGYGTGRDTIKGLITIMNEKILGKTNDANGNYLIVRFNTYNSWRYHIFYEQVPGEDYTGKTTYTYNGVAYYEDHIVESRSSNTDVSQQNPPEYTGYEQVGNSNETGQTGGNNGNNARWTTGSGNNQQYHVRYYYDRIAYPITYLDGIYVNGNGNTVLSRPTNLLRETDGINHGTDLTAEEYKEYVNYVPTLPADQEGYVFEGWYLDETCSVPYVWGKMPIGGIKLHAKWRQVQYRVFLHPQAGTSETDPTLDWGSDSQQMNFRVDYDGKVSTPFGTRDGYEFIGWYTDPSGSPKSMFNGAETRLNVALEDSNVLHAYDKETDFTDPMDKWGNGATTNADVNRFWITKKLDLYAKWRQKLDDAEGINVQYDAGEGTNAPTDSTLYLDASFAVTQAAATPPDGQQFNCWVMQKWNPDGGEDGTGAYEDVVPLATYSPGEQYEVLREYAKRELTDGSTTDDPRYKYTVRLRADYIDPGTVTQTFIHFYANDRDKDGNPIPGVTAYDPVTSPEANEPKDLTTYHNNIQINQAVDILSIESVLNGSNLYDGYKFLGWAKGQTREDALLWLKLNADGTSYTVVQDGVTYSNVTKIAADEVQPYDNLYGVWEKKKYKVTVNKVVVGTEDDNTIPFNFVQNGLPDGSATTSYFQLVGSSTPVQISGKTYTNKKEFLDVPYLTDFTVKEEDTEGFVTAVKYSCTNADDSTKNIDNQSIDNGGQITVYGDISITVTNSRKTVPIKVVKVDQGGTALEGAGFTFDGKDFEGNTDTEWTSTIVDNDAVITSSDSVPFGTYTLKETGIPAGFDEIEGPVTIEVTAGAEGSVAVSAKVNGKTSDSAKVSFINPQQPELGYIVTIMNTAGVELPHTGGLGTVWIYLIGSLLIVGCGVLLLRKRQIKSGKSA